mmetsp:Transcript_3434/g.8664  ORF Transcript_3434/g.8664 Transcript_3434/m.8664 type:complete len:156 (-) Transcript_3434:378-845(-)
MQKPGRFDERTGRWRQSKELEDAKQRTGFVGYSPLWELHELYRTNGASLNLCTESLIDSMHSVLLGILASDDVSTLDVRVRTFPWPKGFKGRRFAGAAEHMHAANAEEMSRWTLILSNTVLSGLFATSSPATPGCRRSGEAPASLASSRRGRMAS